MLLRIDNKGVLALFGNSSSSGSWNVVNNSNFSMATLSANTWYHIAIVRDNSYMYGFLNGSLKKKVSVSSGTKIRTNGPNFYLGSTCPVPIETGSNIRIRACVMGYIKEFRISKVVRYNSNFTPSLEPFEVD